MLNLSAHESDVPPALVNRRDWKYFDQKLTALRVNDVESIMERGRLLSEAKDELERGSFEAMVKGHFDLGTARMYRIVATHPVISNRCHGNALPSSLRTLFELTKLPSEVLQAKLKDGSINPRTERGHVMQWRRERRGQVEVDGEEIKRPSTTEQWKAARAEIETLKAKLKSSGGSLFDLKVDGVKEIAEVIAATVPEGKASALASAIAAAVKERKRKRQAPAG
jgi:hypothetical protein